MKRLLAAFFILASVAFMLGLVGCKTNTNINCPGFAVAKKLHSPLLTFNHHKNSGVNSSKPATQAGNSDTHAATNQNVAMLATADMRIKIRMPNILGGQMETDKELEDMNKLLTSYSNNKVALQRNDKGKLFLKAHSIKDIFALAKKINNPRGYYERKQAKEGVDRSGAALAAGILGPIGFVFAFIPILSFAGILISVAAIVAGALGIKSHRRGLAITGLVFGILGLIISIIMSLYYLVLFFSLIIIGL